MAAPRSITYKAEQLAKALDKVNKLSTELEEWFANKTNDEAAMEFFYGEHLDSPYEFDLSSLLEELNGAVDGTTQYLDC